MYPKEDNPQLKYLGSGLYLVQTGWTYIYKPDRDSRAIWVEVVEDFATDLASIPKGLQTWFPKSRQTANAGIVHDGCYVRCVEIDGKPIRDKDKAFADKIFHEILLADGVPLRRAKWMHRAVDWFGEKPWREESALGLAAWI